LTESLLSILFITDQMEKSLLFKIFIWENVQQKLLCLILAHPFELLVLFNNLFGKPPIVQGKGKLPYHKFTVIKKWAVAGLMWLEPDEWTLKLEKFFFCFNRSGPQYFPHNLLSDICIHERFRTQFLFPVPVEWIALDYMSLESLFSEINEFIGYNITVFF